MRLLTAAVVAASTGMAGSTGSAATHTYTPANSAADLWSAGTGWDVAPASNVATRLTFVGANGTVLEDGLSNTNTNDLAGAFQLNLLDLQGTGAAAGGSVININAAAPSTGLELISNGAVTPIVNLNALAGASGLTYNVNAPLTLTNNTLFTGAGTANFNFTGGVTGPTATLTKSGASTLTLGGFTSIGQLVIGNNNNANGKVAIASGGSISIGGGTGTLSIGTSNTGTAGFGVLDASLAASFTANVATVNLGGTGNNNVQAGGTLNLGASNTITAATSFVMGNSTGAQNPATSLVTTAAGSTTNINTPNMTIAASKANATFTLGSGATVTLRGAAGGTSRGQMNIGNYTTGGGSTSGFASATGFGNANMSAGTFDAMLTNLNIGTQNTGSSSSNILGQLTLGGSGANHLDVSGTGSVVTIGRNLSTSATGRGIGTLTIDNLDSSSSITTSTPASPAILIGQGADGDSRGVGTLNLNGGTLTVNTTGAAIGGNANGTSTVNFNGGTLRAGASSANWISGVSRVNVRDGGVTFDTNGNNVTIAQALSHSNTGTLGPVTITNGGTSYSANPNVVVTDPANNGAYAIATPTISGGSVTGITLAGAQNFTQAPTVTITGGGAGATGASATVGFTPDNATDGGVTKIGTGTLTLGGANTYTGNTNVNAGRLDVTGSLTSNVTIASGADLGGEGSTTGSLTFGGASKLFFDADTPAAFSAGSVNASGATVVVTAGTAPLGEHVVLSTTGGITGTAGTNFVYNSRGTISVSGDGLSLLVNNTGAATLVWKGNAASPTFWDINATTNWEGAGPEKFFDGDAVTFDDTAASFDVAVQPASVSPSSVTFDNSTNAYTLRGGAVNGTASLTKNGSNTLILASDNSYTGGTTINAGTIQLGDGTNAGGTFGGGAVVNDAAIVTNHGANNSTLANNITGTGSLTVAGSGTLNVTGTNTYTGTTTVSAGTFQLGGTGSLGTGAVVNNAAIVAVGNNAIAGDISGAGSVSTAGTGNLTLTGNNALHSGAVNVGAGSTLQVGNGGTGGTLGTGAIGNAGTLVFNRSDDSTVAAPITGTGTVSKLGAGNLTLSGANVVGSLDVGAGVDVAGGTLTVPAGASITVGSAGTGNLRIGVNTSVAPATTPGAISTGTLDASAAAGFMADVAMVQVGATQDRNIGVGTLKLPAASSITAATSFIVGNSSTMFNGPGESVVTTEAGAGTTTIRTPVFTVGGNKSSGSFTLGAGGTLDVAGIGAGGRAALTVGSTPFGGGSGNWVGTLDTSDGTFSGMLSGLVVGARQVQISIANTTGTFTTGASSANHVDIRGASATNGGVVTIGSAALTTGNSGSATGTWTIGNLDATSQIVSTDNGTGILLGVNAPPPGAGQTQITGTGTLNLNGGTLAITTAGAAIAGGSGTSTVNFNGTTLKAGASSAAWIQGLTSANVQAGGANFDTNGFDVTVPQVLAGTGGLTKGGAGTMTLAGANTYTGATTVTGGTLELTQSNTSGSAINVDGATLRLTPGGNKVLGTKSLNLSAAGRLEMSDNDLIVDYTGASPEGQVRQWVKDGRANAASGIFSTPGDPDDDVVLAVADNAAWGKTIFDGVNIDTDTVVGKYTYFGDANLDGKVTGDDYLNVDANLGTGDSWLEGDFNMSGVTTGDDYLAIDANLGKGTSDPLAFAELKEEMVAAHVAMFGEEYLVKLAQVEAEGFGASVVPEPAAISLIGLGAVGLLGRRRRRPC